MPRTRGRYWAFRNKATGYIDFVRIGPGTAQQALDAYLNPWRVAPGPARLQQLKLDPSYEERIRVYRYDAQGKRVGEDFLYPGDSRYTEGRALVRQRAAMMEVRVASSAIRNAADYEVLDPDEQFTDQVDSPPKCERGRAWVFDATRGRMVQRRDPRALDAMRTRAAKLRADAGVAIGSMRAELNQLAQDTEAKADAFAAEPEDLDTHPTTDRMAPAQV